MLSNKLLMIFASIFIIFSCTKEQRQERARKSLDKELGEIIDYAQSKNCTDPLEWNYVSYGTKACGGHVGYLAYYKDIDTTFLFKKIQEYSDSEMEYNKKWGASSTCNIANQPDSIVCENNKPTLVY
tara:strand:+ start:58 stop:438 length:381 start_codon:yes stop_codon:yes gene_type:complete